MSVRKIAVLCVLLGVSAQSLAVGCTAPCPSRPIGVIFAGSGSLFVAPAVIPASFTGCQIAWNEARQLSIRIAFQSGRIQRFEAFNAGGAPNTLACIYEDGRLSANSSRECAEMDMEQLRDGLPATPVEEAYMDWPDGQCFPTLRSR